MHGTVKVEKAPSSPVEAIGRIKRHVAEYREGGLDREGEDLGLGERFDLDLEKIKAWWRKVRQDRAENDRLRSFKEVRLEDLLQPVEEPEETEEAAVVGGVAAVIAETQPKSKEEKKEEERAKSKAFLKNLAPQAAEPQVQTELEGEPLILSKAGPYDSAAEYARRRCHREGSLALYFWGEKFWEWNGQFYQEVSTAQVNTDVWAFLDGARVRTAEGSDRFRPKPADVEALIKALKAQIGLSVDAPCWLEGEGPTNVLVFKNGLVDVDTGKLLPLTPKLWVQSGLDFDFDPQARCPVWENFLGEVFPGDEASQDCVEEQLGLGMTNDIRFHKAGLWIGDTGRNGKSTLAHIAEKLSGSYVSLSFNTWVSGPNEAECMIGKKVGCFPDVRLKPGKWYGQNFDPGGLDHKSKELVLKITGGDHVSIGRKYQPAWQGVLPTKMILISNEVPNFNDPILASRFIKIAFTQSFFGREDLFLKEKLAAELPGIANRCLRAYRRLRERGFFVQPESGLKLERQVAAKSNDFVAFVQDRCVIEAGGTVPCGALHTKFKAWCGEKGRADLLMSVSTPNLLTPKLKTVPGLQKLSVHRPGGVRHYLGLRLKTKLDRQDEEG
jgi:putative DNA primase/helicase